MNELGCFNMNSNWIWIIVAYLLLTQCGGGCGIFDNIKGIFGGLGGGCGEGNTWIWLIVLYFLFCQKDFAC